MGVLNKEDFNLTIEYNEFDKLYSVSRGDSNTIREWTVIGRKLNTSSDVRGFDYHLISSPISSYVRENEHILLSSLKIGAYVSRKREEVIAAKYMFIEEEYKKKLNELKDEINN